MELKILKQEETPENVIEHSKAVCKKAMKIAANFKDADKDLIKKGALLFFIGGDNFMAPCNGLSEKEIEDILVEINDEIGIGLKAGIGVGRNMEDAAYMADLGLEEIRDHDNGMWTWVIEKEY